MLQQEENTKNPFHNKYMLIKQYQFILHVNGCAAISSFISTAWTRYILSSSRLTLLKYPVINIYTNIIIMTHLAHKKPTCFIFTNFKKNINRIFFVCLKQNWQRQAMLSLTTIYSQAYYWSAKKRNHSNMKAQFVLIGNIL